MGTIFKLRLLILFNGIIIGILDSIVGIQYSFYFWKRLFLFESFTKEQIDVFYQLLNRDFSYDYETGNVVIRL